MSEKRRDSKNRILYIGESQRKDGRYAYKYTDNYGKVKFVYSWKLVPTDTEPYGKRKGLSLREKEKQIARDLSDFIDVQNGKITVAELYKKFIFENANVKPNTILSRTHLSNRLYDDIIGNCIISKVKPEDAKEWAKRWKRQGLAYKTIKNYKRSICAAFQMAVQNDYIRKNPFSFNIRDVINDDSKTAVALSKEQQTMLMDFVKNDTVYSKNYNELVIFLETGIRASELCGLTKNNIDLENRIVTIDHQLLKDPKTGYYIASPKTKSSYRKIYMTDSVYKAFLSVTSSATCNFSVDGYKDFLFINSKGCPMTVAGYDALFKRLIGKFIKNHSVDMPQNITPHTLRHTFCTNMANAGMNPKSLQYIMGHSTVSMTLNYYSHTSFDSSVEEIKRIISA